MATRRRWLRQSVQLIRLMTEKFKFGNVGLSPVNGNPAALMTGPADLIH